MDSSESEIEYVNNGKSEEEKEEHFEELEYLQNTFRGLKPYDLELERTSKSEPSNSHVASSSSTENIEQRNTVARINTLDWCIVVVKESRDRLLMLRGNASNKDRKI